MRALIAIALVLSGLAALLPSQAQAQAFPARTDGRNIRAALVADGPPVPGREWALMVRFSPTSPEWHGYWANPGDAGVGMALDWRLPPGWSAGEPRYPIPRRLVIAGLMNHVFEGEYAVQVPIRVPAGATVSDLPPIGLTLDYLACTDAICVPERAVLSLDPSRATADPRIDRWRTELAPPLDQPVRFAVTGNMLRLAIPLPASLTIDEPHVFIGTRELVRYAAPQRFSRKGDLLIAEVPLAEDAAAPPALEGIVALGRNGGFHFRGISGEVPPAGDPLAGGPAAFRLFVFALLGAFVGGVLLNVMPCVFPILSLKALALAKAGTGAEGEARRDALAYTAGVVIACLALGAVMLALRAGGEQVGWAFQLQEPGVVVALLVLAVAITANFLGVFEVPGFGIAGRGGAGSGSFATGLLAAFVATPCTGPLMAAALGAALLLPAPQAMALFAALGLGLALPFLLLGLIPALRRWLPRPGPWMVRFRRWMALPMALTALALAWLAWRLGGANYALAALALASVFTAFLAMLWSPRGPAAGRRAAILAALGLGSLALVAVLPGVRANSAASEERGLLDARPFSEEALAKARASGRPVFVYFTADWCLTCKVNEATAIERESTREAFDKAGVIVLRGDWTRRDEAITRFLTARGAAGVPLYLWYPAGSRGAPLQLPQVLTPALLAALPRGSAG